jgi:3(or 17)beta-hydroxysteroid dehydrogenase
MDRVKGKVALITGSASGIGKGTAQLLAQEGATVIVSDINVPGGREVAAQIRKDGGKATFIKLDVTRERDWINAMEKIVARFGRLDYLANIAGDAVMHSFEEATEKEYYYMFDLLVKGIFLGTKYAFKTMKKTGGGAIVNMSSQAGIKGGIDCSLYGAAKAAVILLTKSAALEGSKLGYGLNIRVNSVHPGVVDTPLKTKLEALNPHPELTGKIEEHIPLGYVSQPLDIAKVILFLMSDDSSYVTGAQLYVEGGMLA